MGPTRTPRLVGEGAQYQGTGKNPAQDQSKQLRNPSLTHVTLQHPEHWSHEWAFRFKSGRQDPGEECRSTEAVVVVTGDRLCGVGLRGP